MPMIDPNERSGIDYSGIGFAGETLNDIEEEDSLNPVGLMGLDEVPEETVDEE